ncbi:MAG: DHA2 family efflux MFS transporter permease subunit [Acetobacteraceae bacterium]|nr:DHA2 family efflux MFS transporter permease subunit [Acetobacteraceae bacterium]
MMSGLDSTMVNVSLDTLGQVFGAPLGIIQWVTSAYLLSLALALPLSGWLMDRLGARRIFLGCFAVFVVGSTLSAMATTVEALIACRVLQGIAGGLLAPMMQMMMARHAGKHMARVIGIAAMPVMIGQMLGPSLGGFLLTHLGWRWIFLMNLPVGVLAIFCAWFVLPRDDVTVPRRLDLLGFLMISPGLALLLHGLAALALGDATAPIGLLLSVILLGGFILHALRARNTALIDLRLFTGRTFRAAAMTQFLSNAINFGGQLLLPLYFLKVRGASPGLTGLLLAPMALGMFFALPVMGRLSERFGARMISGAGAGIALLGTVPFALAGPETSLLVLTGALFVRGFGVGSITIPSAAAAYASVPRESLSSATTAINICQRFGGPVGTTALALFLQHQLTANYPLAAYAATFWLLAALAGAGLLAALRLPGHLPTRY